MIDRTISDPITMMNCDKELSEERKVLINEWSKQKILGLPKHSKDADGNCVFNGKIIKTGNV